MYMSVKMQEVLFQFRELREALIDACSIIYIDRAGFLAELAQVLNLYSLPEILVEAHLDNPQIRPLECITPGESNDQKLIACALVRKMAVISDDRKILVRLREEGVSHFNAVMMLNFLLYLQRISTAQHSLYFRRLNAFAWYSEEVLGTSKDVYLAALTGCGLC